MVRVLNFVCVALMGFTILALYHVSEKTRVAHMELAKVNAGIVQEHSTIGVLETEWQHVASPEHIQQLAQARLGMAYANGDHVTVDDFAAYHWLSLASVAPDLTSEERSKVTALRQSLLDRLAPNQTNYVADTSTDAGDAGNQQNAIPAADKAQAAPTDAVATAPLPDNPPAESASADKAASTAKPAITAAAKPAPVKEIATAAPLTSDPTPMTRKYMVQLASVPSAKLAAAEAERLQKKYASILQDAAVGVRQVDLGSKGIRQRVVAGPFDDFDTAKARCTQLSAQKQDCRVISVSD